VAVSEELLEILVCPKCKGRLELSPRSAGDAPAATDGALICGRCRVRYPIEDDIPVLIVSAAKPLD
jgi:uncharacterized protein YbaR (Trm112 family)